LLPRTVAVSALPERMLTVREAARRLGVSTATVYKLCATGGLAHVRVLNAVRIPPAALAAAMAAAPSRKA
jgi:excisionase family DNA binding protein